MNIRKQSVRIMKYRHTLLTTRKKDTEKNSDKTITSVLLGSYIKAMSISLLFGIFFFIVITGKEMVHRQNLNNSRILTTVSYFINMQLEDMRKFSYKIIIEEELQSIFGQPGRRKEQKNQNLLNE
jgi:two-component system sensor histidine kinase YesM